MEITDEVRAAVLAAECETRGHVIDVSQAIRDNPNESPDRSTIRVMAREGDTIPHLFCRRCGWVWLIGADGPSYDAAEDAMNERSAPKHRRKLRRDLRRERAAAEQAGAAARAAAEKAAQATPAPGQGTPAPPRAPVPTPTP